MRTISCLNDLDENLRICIYGAGGAGTRFQRFLALRRPDVHVVCFLDTFRRGKIDSRPIFTPCDMEALAPPYDLIVICSNFWEDIEKSLQEKHLPTYALLNPALYDAEDVERHPDKKLCLIFSNCQGQALRTILKRSASFDHTYNILVYLNYKGERPPAHLLSRCDLFLYQPLDDRWGALSPERILQEIPRRTPCLAFPNMYFSPYWPFYTKEPREEMKRIIPFGVYPHGDAFVLKLMAGNCPAEEIIRRYLEADIPAMMDLDALLEKYTQVEREKEKRTDVRHVDFVLEHFRTEKVFHTVNHPHGCVLLHVANQILSLTGYDRVPGDENRFIQEMLTNVEIPIHPSVIRHYGLECVDSGTRYNINCSQMSFEEYVSHYINDPKAGRFQRPER